MSEDEKKAVEENLRRAIRKARAVGITEDWMKNLAMEMFLNPEGVDKFMKISEVMDEDMTTEEKIQALIDEGGETRESAIEMLINMGELDGDE